MQIITTEKLKAMMASGEKFLLIDLRSKEELKYGMLPGSYNLPIEELVDALSMDPKSFKDKYGFERFSKEDKVVVYCRTGSRSSMASQYLESLGYKVINYSGSVKEWSKIDNDVKMY